MSWTTCEATQAILKGRPANYFLDSSIQDLLNRQPGSSVREIVQERQLPAYFDPKAEGRSVPAKF
jgi:hypothetical protein